MKLSTLLAITAAAAVSARPALAPRADEVAEADKYLIKLSETEEKWVTEDEKWELRKQGINFFDKTYSQAASAETKVKRQAVSYPTTARFTSAVNSLISSLSTSNMRTNLQGLVAFNNRYYRSTTGSQSATWLRDLVQDTIDAAGGGGTVAFFTHSSWSQNSIIATIPGQTDKTIVVGGHFDSINLNNPSSGRAPGADDDGSGSITNLEILKAYLASSEVRAGNAVNTVEFHWYAAEEAGLLGSQAIFDSYSSQGRNVIAMLNHDMTGYTAGMTNAGQTISLAVVTDYVNSALSNFVRLMIRTYTSLPITTSTCGYACSDHASATDAGFPSAYVFESPDAYSSPYIHTTSDTLSTVDFTHMLDHAKAGLGFVYELAFTSF
ncbi:Peptidase M28 [Neofusicoccum parvum]|uniref:Peptide hydrolase n=2 Tax=Neofusicoccum parvum TaxID=310453 RepID=R1GBR8_BOTPV|nr:putative leucyl aminopeptidase protein [Neofusicoccum parvum UCRNP2]GME26928.1 Peptidase M28 [Neofusicoccum parvum]GME54471.1 Peptidase M28 [Neofusicoccum parvum]